MSERSPLDPTRREIWQRRSRLHQAAGAGRQGESVAADRSGARPARPEHHGVLQGVQCPDAGVEPGLPIPVVITAFADKSFTFIMKTPPATVLIKKAAGIEKGSPKPHTDKVGKLTRAQAEEIAKAKMPDLTAADLDAAVRTSPAVPARWASRWRALNVERIEAHQGLRAARWTAKNYAVRRAEAGQGMRDREVR